MQDQETKGADQSSSGGSFLLRFCGSRAVPEGFGRGLRALDAACFGHRLLGSIDIEIPLHRAAEAFVESDFGLIAQFSPGTGDVGERVFDVAFAGRTIDRRLCEAELVGDRLIDLVERMTAAGTDVEDATG